MTLFFLSISDVQTIPYNNLAYLCTQVIVEIKRYICCDILVRREKKYYYILDRKDNISN